MKRFHFAGLGLIVFLFVMSSCDDSGSASKLGAPCDENTVCDGVCNLGMPGGMCIVECDTDNPCKSGVCTPFNTEKSYCVPSCQENSECRDEYSCVNFSCVPKQPVGASCDDYSDCLSCETQSEACNGAENAECVENICSVQCSDQNQCPDGTICAESDGKYWCVPVDFQTGEGTAGESCEVNQCSEGFECIDDLMGYSGFSFCSDTCETKRDCPPEMACRIYNNSTSKYCVPREFCESCDIDSQCGYDQDKCVSSSEGDRYCSVECDPQMTGTCNVDSSCKEAFLCSDGSWTDDCANCATGSCDSASPSVFQCFKDYGSCTGDGTSCAPCHNDSDCTTDAGCVEIPSTGNTICADHCDANGFCPDGFICNDTLAGKVCLPRTDSCTNPSGDKTMCEECQETKECLTGGCFEIPGSGSTTKYCLDFCTGPADCAPNGDCVAVTGDATDLMACVPDATAVDCAGWLNQ